MKKAKYSLKKSYSNKNYFTGNILKQPIMKKNIQKTGNIDKVADDVMKNGILLGCHQGMKVSELKYICNTFKKLINESLKQNSKVY